MNNVIQFPRPGKRVVISEGSIVLSDDPAEVGQWKIFVELVGGDGEDECVWDGCSHDEACRVAAALSEYEGGLPIIDEVAA